MLLYIVGWSLIGFGIFAILSGIIGLFRMPDFYTKLHAAGVLECFGVPICLIGLACIQASYASSFKLVLAAILILILNPISTHAIAKASLLAKSFKQENKPKKPNKSNSNGGKK